MKNYIVLLSLFLTSVTFAQTITSKLENVSIEQQELLKKVNQFYPVSTVSTQINNFYADGKIIDSQQEFDLRNSKFTSYKLGIEPDNKKLLFEYASDETGKVYGDISLFKGNVLRTTFSETKNEIEVSLNGKAVYKKKV